MKRLRNVIISDTEPLVYDLWIKPDGSVNANISGKWTSTPIPEVPEIDTTALEELVSSLNDLSLDVSGLKTSVSAASNNAVSALTLAQTNDAVLNGDLPIPDDNPLLIRMDEIREYGVLPYLASVDENLQGLSPIIDALVEAVFETLEDRIAALEGGNPE